MNRFNCIDLSYLEFDTEPFPHFSSSVALKNGLDYRVFEWFKTTDEWILTETDFYEQYEFNILKASIPDNVKCLITEDTIDTIEIKIKNEFKIASLSLVGVTAHKLINNQHIGIHNDYISGDETHRLVIQINEQWTEDNGGFLMLFSSGNVNDISKIIKPINNSAVGFEISPLSHHAVSKTYNFNRYTLVYTFKSR